MRSIPAFHADIHSVLDLERSSIREWVQSCSGYLEGTVLDYGAGLQPYRDVVENAGGIYIPHDLTSYPSSVALMDVGEDELRGSVVTNGYDAILCNQVLQYVPLYSACPDPESFTPTPLYSLLDDFCAYLRNREGYLVMTGGTCWREIEPADHSRLTVTGIRALLEQSGFHVERCESRAAIEFPGFELSLGWGVLARA